MNKPRPHQWKSGPDPLAHDQYYAWLKHRSQAMYRKEAHELTFEQWQTIWNTDDNWSKRGNRSESVVLTRYDKEQPWNVDNCHIKNRKQHRADSAFENHIGRTYRPRKIKKRLSAAELNI